MKIEGYWFSKNEPTFPKPIPYVLSEKEAKDISILIKKKETRANVKIYKGYSKSRIDKTSVGSKEYSSGDWIWPEGFRTHYVEKYRVKPSDEFLNFIGYNK